MNKLVHQSKIFLNKNGSTILTCLGGLGVVVTSIMAVKATPKALALLEKVEEEKGEELTKFETVRIAAPVYIPSALVGVSTLACIFGANILNKRQQAGLISAYALLDSSYKEYKNKVVELYGEDANNTVKEELAKDKYEEIDISVNDGKQLFYDEFSRRYFESTTENVLRAEYELNRMMSQDSGLFLNEFYELLGLEPVEYGDYLGWSSFQLTEMYWHCWIDFEHTKVAMDDGLECTIISMPKEPTYEFYEY